MREEPKQKTPGLICDSCKGYGYHLVTKPRKEICPSCEGTGSSERVCIHGKPMKGVRDCKECEEITSRRFHEQQ